MISNAEKLYNLIANDSKKKQSLFLIALTNPNSALEKICEIGNIIRKEIFNFQFKSDFDKQMVIFITSLNELSLWI